MIDLSIENGINVSESMQNTTLLDVQTINNYYYPMSFDTIFFNEVATISGEKFYRLFVRLSLYNAKYFNSYDKDLTVEILPQSSATFQLVNSGKLETLKVLTNDGKTASQLQFDHSFLGIDAIENSGGRKTRTPFYCLLIPQSSFKLGEINKIRFSASIYSPSIGDKNNPLTTFAQDFTGYININGTNAYKLNHSEGNTYVANKVNYIEGYFNMVKGDYDKHFGAIYMASKRYVVQNKSTFEDDTFYEDYILKTQSSLICTNEPFMLEGFIANQIQNTISGLSELGEYNLKSNMYIVTTDNKKLSDYYDFEKQHNAMIAKSSEVKEIYNTDYSYLDPNTQQVKLVNTGDKKGILVNPNLNGTIAFCNEIDLNGIYLLLNNQLVSKPDNVEILYDENIEMSSTAINFLVNVDRDVISAFQIDDLKGYIKNHETIS